MTDTIAIDARLGETQIENEAGEIAALVSTVEEEMRKSHDSRGAHPKAHGVVVGRFHVRDNLPPDLARGVFVPGRIYRAIIRFSSGLPSPDYKPGAFGMAIKLLEVDSAPILDDYGASTQDFVLITGPAFFLNDLSKYAAFVKAQANGDLLEVAKILGLPGGRNIAKMAKLCGDVLKEHYFSQLPYRLGVGDDAAAVKYSAFPVDAEGAQEEPTRFPPPLSENFLRDKLTRTLQEGEARFAFSVQRAATQDKVEDSMTEWSGPFDPVADIFIPSQDIQPLAEFGEALSFTPWHASETHRPLGAMNRARRAVYEKSARLRKESGHTVDLADPRVADAFGKAGL